MGKKLKFIVTVANQFTEQVFSFGVVTQDKKSSVNSFETILYFSGLGYLDIIKAYLLDFFGKLDGLLDIYISKDFTGCLLNTTLSE